MLCLIRVRVKVRVTVRVRACVPPSQGFVAQLELQAGSVLVEIDVLWA